MEKICNGCGGILGRDCFSPVECEQIRTQNEYLMSYPYLVICSAIKMQDGTIIRGHRHHDCIRTARSIPRLEEMQVFEQGFINNRNEFISREEARIIEETRRVNENDMSRPPFVHDTLLFSEDLY